MFLSPLPLAGEGWVRGRGRSSRLRRSPLTLPACGWAPPSPASGRGVSAALASFFLLTACHVDVTDKAQAAREKSAREAIDASEGKIACIPPGGSAFAYACGIDRTQTQDGLILTLRHPDGGFRRLLVTDDGRGVVAADGAELAQVTPLGKDLIEVVLGGARYRLPATVRGGGPK